MTNESGIKLFWFVGLYAVNDLGVNNNPTVF